MKFYLLVALLCSALFSVSLGAEAGATQTTTPEAPHSEAEKHLQDTSLRWQHSDWAQALRSAEAVYKLNPADRHARIVYARALIVAGLANAGGGRFADPDDKIDYTLHFGNNVSSEGIDSAVAYIGRGLDELASAGWNPQPTTRPILGIADDPLIDNTVQLVRLFLGNMRYERFERSKASGGPGVVLSNEQAAAVEQISGLFRHYRLEVQYPAAAKLANGESMPSYTAFVDALLRDACWIWPRDGAQWTSDWQTILADSEAVARQQLKQPATRATVKLPDGRRVVVAGPRVWLPPILARLAAQPYVTADFTYWAQYHDITWRMTDADYKRLDAVLLTFQQEPPLASVPQVEAMRQGIALMRRNQEVQHQNENRPRTERPLNPAPDMPIFKVQGAAPKPLPAIGPGTAWPDSLELLDLRKTPDQGEIVAFPRTDFSSGHVYAAVFHRNGDLRLMRSALKTGATTVANSIAYESPDLNPLGIESGNGVLCDGAYLFYNRFAGVYVLPLDGSPAWKATGKTHKLPSTQFQAAALLDGVLYLALGTPGQDGFILSLDRKSGELATIVSDLSKPAAPAAPTPFDNTAPIRTFAMFADPARHQLVFLASHPAWKPELCGWWAYRPATHTFSLLANYRPDERSLDGIYADVPRGRTLLFGGPGPAGKLLDLETGATQPLPEVPLVADSFAGRQRGPALGGPLVVCGDWIWGAFGRYRQSPGKPDPTGRPTAPVLQTFDWLADTSRERARQWGSWPTCIEPADYDRVVVCDDHALWLLSVPAENPEAMDLLLKPDRPLNMPVERIGDPPAGGDLPWASVTTVYDFAKNLGTIRQALFPIIQGDRVYTMTLRNIGKSSQGTGGLQLASFPLTSGGRKDLGKLPGQFPLRIESLVQQISTNYSDFEAAAIDDSRYYFAKRDSIWAVPLDGSSSRQLPAEKDQNHLFRRELASVDGSLFVAKTCVDRQRQTWASLLRYDAKTQQFEEMLDFSKPAAATQPSGTPEPEYHVLALRADAQRKRVLYFVQSRDGDAQRDGLWACSAQGKPQRLLQMRLESAGDSNSSRLIYAGQVRDARLLVYTSQAAFDLDVIGLKAKLIWRPTPAMPATDWLSGDGMVGPTWLGDRLELTSDWLWMGQFGRIRLDGSRGELFPWLRPMDMRNTVITPILLERRNQDMIVADHCGMWILHSK